jgi:hypothetical protein
MPQPNISRSIEFLKKKLKLISLRNLLQVEVWQEVTTADTNTFCDRVIESSRGNSPMLTDVIDDYGNEGHNLV